MIQMLIAALFATTVIGQAPIARGCALGEYPSFRFGFAELADRLGTSIVGRPLTCEYADPRGSGDVLQETTRGLAFWRKSTNTPTFTDGSVHYALVPDAAASFVWWIGSTIDPTDGALLPQGAPDNRCLLADPALRGDCP